MWERPISEWAAGLLALAIVGSLILFEIWPLNPGPSGNSILTTLAAVQATIFAIVFSVVILGVSLSTSRYSPRLADLFRSDPDYKWTVYLLGVSIGISILGLYIYPSINIYERRFLLFFSGVLAVSGLIVLFHFVSKTLYKTTPEGILTRIRDELSPEEIIQKAHDANQEPTNADPFLVLVSVIESTISDLDTRGATLGLDILENSVIDLLRSGSSNPFEDGTPVDESLEGLCVDRIPNIEYTAAEHDLTDIALTTAGSAKAIGEISIQQSIGNPFEHIVRGQSTLIDGLGFDPSDERIRGEVIDVCKDLLKNAAENRLWSEGAKGIGWVGWRAAGSVMDRGIDEAVDVRYTSLIILGYPKILYNAVQAADSLEDIPPGHWIRFQIGFYDELEPIHQILGASYSALAELTSALIRYEIRTGHRIADWSSVAAGWSDGYNTLSETPLTSLEKLWLGTILYLDYMESESPAGVMEGFNPHALYDASNDFLVETIDGILSADLDVKAHIDFIPGQVNSVEYPLTGSRVAPITDPDEEFSEWLNRRQHVYEVTEDISTFAETIDEE